MPELTELPLDILGFRDDDIAIGTEIIKGGVWQRVMNESAIVAPCEGERRLKTRDWNEIPSEDGRTEFKTQR